MTFDTSSALPRLVAARDIEPAEVPGHSFRVLADAADTDGAYSLTEATSPVGAGVPPHAHDDAVECFFVLDGHYRLTVGGTVVDADPGGFVLVPRGAPHQFEVVGATEAKAVVIFAPAGFEEAFRAMPEVFGMAGEPGPVWAALNAKLTTRLFPPHARGLTGPAPVIGPSATGAVSRLAGPDQTGTGLSVLLRSDLVPAGVWDIDPAVTAIWIVNGRYRFDTPNRSFTAGEGELVTLGHAERVQAVSLSPSARALFLSLAIR
jgi:mannose-6-phosphate isomerase-like protein (cupin superfamily)